MSSSSQSPEPPTKKRRRSTPSVQTAKKRELDRIAQKKSRDRARNRVLELEDKIVRLQSDDKQKQIADLMRTVEDLRKENDRLRGMTEKIKCLTESAGTRESNHDESVNNHKEVVTPQSPESAHSGTSPDQNTDLNTLDQWWDDNDQLTDSSIIVDLPYMPPEASTKSYAATTTTTTTNIVDLAPRYDFMPFTSMNDFDSSLSVGTPGQLHVSTTGLVVPDNEKWTVSNDAFIFGINTGRQSFTSTSAPSSKTRYYFSPEIMNSHAAYKAILWGNQNRKEEKERSHPLWLALRQVDEKVFGDWKSKAQKIAMMFVCQRMLLYKCNPCKETLERVPSFLRPRPSQETLQHPAVIDFLIWPGLRDRLVFSHKRYTSTGDFSAAFCKYLRFHWPYGDDDILKFREGSGGGWAISERFERFACDIENWTMDEGFFDGFAEMRFDIPSSERRREELRRGEACAGTWEEQVWDFMPMTA